MLLIWFDLVEDIGGKVSVIWTIPQLCQHMAFCSNVLDKSYSLHIGERRSNCNFVKLHYTVIFFLESIHHYAQFILGEKLITSAQQPHIIKLCMISLTLS